MCLKQSVGFLKEGLDIKTERSEKCEIVSGVFY